MIKQDFERFHNSASEAINAAWCLVWSVVAAAFNRLSKGATFMRNLAVEQEPAINKVWHGVDWKFGEPITDEELFPEDGEQ